MLWAVHFLSLPSDLAVNDDALAIRIVFPPSETNMEKAANNVAALLEFDEIRRNAAGTANISLAFFFFLWILEQARLGLRELFGGEITQ